MQATTSWQGDRTIIKTPCILTDRRTQTHTGSGESGKSTIVKQMKILYQGGYSKEELATWRIPVYRNLMESAQALVSAVYKYEFQFQNELNEVISIFKSISLSLCKKMKMTVSCRSTMLCALWSTN